MKQLLCALAFIILLCGNLRAETQKHELEFSYRGQRHHFVFILKKVVDNTEAVVTVVQHMEGAEKEETLAGKWVFNEALFRLNEKLDAELGRDVRIHIKVEGRYERLWKEILENPVIGRVELLVDKFGKALPEFQNSGWKLGGFQKLLRALELEGKDISPYQLYLWLTALDVLEYEVHPTQSRVVRPSETFNLPLWKGGTDEELVNCLLLRKNFFILVFPRGQVNSKYSMPSGKQQLIKEFGLRAVRQLESALSRWEIMRLLWNLPERFPNEADFEDFWHTASGLELDAWLMFIHQIIDENLKRVMKGQRVKLNSIKGQQILTQQFQNSLLIGTRVPWMRLIERGVDLGRLRPGLLQDFYWLDDSSSETQIERMVLALETSRSLFLEEGVGQFKAMQAFRVQETMGGYKKRILEHLKERLQEATVKNAAVLRNRILKLEKSWLNWDLTIDQAKFIFHDLVIPFYTEEPQLSSQQLAFRLKDLAGRLVMPLDKLTTQLKAEADPLKKLIAKMPNLNWRSEDEVTVFIEGEWPAVKKLRKEIGKKRKEVALQAEKKHQAQELLAKLEEDFKKRGWSDPAVMAQEVQIRILNLNEPKVLFFRNMGHLETLEFIRDFSIKFSLSMQELVAALGDYDETFKENAKYLFWVWEDKVYQSETLASYYKVISNSIIFSVPTLYEVNHLIETIDPLYWLPNRKIHSLDIRNILQENLIPAIFGIKGEIPLRLRTTEEVFAMVKIIAQKTQLAMHTVMLIFVHFDSQLDQVFKEISHGLWPDAIIGGKVDFAWENGLSNIETVEDIPRLAFEIRAIAAQSFVQPHSLIKELEEKKVIKKSTGSELRKFNFSNPLPGVSAKDQLKARKLLIKNYRWNSEEDEKRVDKFVTELMLLEYRKLHSTVEFFAEDVVTIIEDFSYNYKLSLRTIVQFMDLLAPNLAQQARELNPRWPWYYQFNHSYDFTDALFSSRDPELQSLFRTFTEGNQQQYQTEEQEYQAIKNLGFAYAEMIHGAYKFHSEDPVLCRQILNYFFEKKVKNFNFLNGEDYVQFFELLEGFAEAYTNGSVKKAKEIFRPLGLKVHGTIWLLEHQGIEWYGLKRKGGIKGLHYNSKYISYTEVKRRILFDREELYDRLTAKERKIYHAFMYGKTYKQAQINAREAIDLFRQNNITEASDFENWSNERLIIFVEESAVKMGMSLKVFSLCTKSVFPFFKNRINKLYQEHKFYFPNWDRTEKSYQVTSLEQAFYLVNRYSLLEQKKVNYKSSFLFLDFSQFTYATLFEFIEYLAKETNATLETINQRLKKNSSFELKRNSISFEFPAERSSSSDSEYYRKKDQFLKGIAIYEVLACLRRL